MPVCQENVLAWVTIPGGKGLKSNSKRFKHKRECVGSCSEKPRVTQAGPTDSNNVTRTLSLFQLSWLPSGLPSSLGLCWSQVAPAYTLPGAFSSQPQH